jgi:nucleoside-triphosphatase THEP1
MDASLFTAREPQARAILNAVGKHRHVLVTGRSGIGKTALLEFVAPVLEASALTIQLERVAPFGNFLRELHTALWDAKALTGQTTDLEADRKAFGKANPNNDTKARSLVDALETWAKTKSRAILVIDDAGGLTPSVTPWLVELERVSTLVVSVTPDALRKQGTKRFWKLLEEVRLDPLTARESGELLDKLMTEHRIVVDEPQMYRNRVLAVAAGVPGELVRLVKYHSADTIVHARDVLNPGQQFVDREERGIAIAPIVFALGAFSIAWRYIARARGDLDAYVLSGIAVGVFFVARLLFAKTFRPRSS